MPIDSVPGSKQVRSATMQTFLQAQVPCAPPASPGRRGASHCKAVTSRPGRCCCQQLAAACCPAASQIQSALQPGWGGLRQHRKERLIARAGVPSFMSLPSLEGYIEVEAVKGVRVVLDGDTPCTEYLVQWKDGSEDTWESGANLSSDLVRDFEEKWWGAARKADFDTLANILAGGKDVLAHAVDENRRSALHFAAALGKPECVKLLLEAGADPNLQDTQGYTPLHMAAGYMHTSTMGVLLQAGSDPQLKDNSGKDVVSLLDGIRNNMPLNLATIMQRLRLEEVTNALTDLLYEEVQAKAILAERRASDGARELLVSWADGHEDSWVLERDVSAALLEDWTAGMEFAPARAILDMVQVNTERRFKVQWSDGYPDSWEPEEHVPSDLITLFASQNPDLFNQRVAAAQQERLAAQAARISTSVTPVEAPTSKPLLLDTAAV